MKNCALWARVSRGGSNGKACELDHHRDRRRGRGPDLLQIHRQRLGIAAASATPAGRIRTCGTAKARETCRPSGDRVHSCACARNACAGTNTPALRRCANASGPAGNDGDNNPRRATRAICASACTGRPSTRTDGPSRAKRSCRSHSPTCCAPGDSGTRRTRTHTDGRRATPSACSRSANDDTGSCSARSGRACALSNSRRPTGSSPNTGRDPARPGCFRNARARTGRCGCAATAEAAHFPA